MVEAIKFAVRTGAGTIVRGTVSGDGGSEFMQVGSGESVSLNLSQSNVLGYERQGSDLVLKLIDGRQIVLSGYFEANTGEENRLYLSTNGEVNEVYLTDGGNGTMYANYGPADTWNKYSALDDLRFTDDSMMVANEPYADDTAGMAAFVPGLLGLGGGGLGTAAAAAGGLGLLGLAGGGGGGGGVGGGGGGTPAHTPPAVNQPDASSALSTKTVDPAVIVSGTGHPGDQVKVVVGDKTGTTTIGTDGTWNVTFPSTDLPKDGTHEAVVTVTGPANGPIVLDGPTFNIDMTPPDVSATEGTKSAGDVENLAEYADGVTIGGQGEAGASIVVQIGTHTQTTTVSNTGNWAVTFPKTQVDPGEYEIPVKITATDAAGNETIVNEVLVVDTVPHPLVINPVTADNIVNGSEAGASLSVTGTSTVGATVRVTVEGISRDVTVGQDGKWSASYPANVFSSGEYDRTITATTTDAAGNPTTTNHTVRVDTVTSVNFAAGNIAGDNIVNATEANAGVQLNGMAEPGATVTVTWGGTTLPATVASNGAWSVTYPKASIPADAASTTVTVNSTDAAGNTASATRQVGIDTQTSVAVNPNQMTDNVVSKAEANGGVQLTGTAEPGARVEVTFEGVTRTVTATGGAWSANFTSAEIAQGTRASLVSVKATDTAGNVATTTHAMTIDTEVTNFTRATLSTGSDNILNNTEALRGLTVTGTVEPGSTVTVNFGTASNLPATVASNGTWTVTVPASAIPQGENMVTLTANARDRYGNTAVHTEQVEVDRVVTPFARTGGTIGGDGILNAEEVAAGLNLSGTGERNSTVVVSLSNGSSETVQVGANGQWSVRFEANELPRGDSGTSMDVTVSATDRAGNTSSFTETVGIDTVAPESPDVAGFSKLGRNVVGIYTESSPDAYEFIRVDQSGVTTDVTGTGGPLAGQSGITDFRFNGSVPDGAYLVVNTEDAAHNSTSTLVVVDNSTASSINLSNTGLAHFDFSAIDLTWAPDAHMTISSQQLMALTGPENTLLVKGDADDQVTLTDVTSQHASQTINGETYNVYTLGSNGATILLDDDITTVI